MGSSGSDQGKVAGSFECDNKLLGSIQYVVFLDWETN